MKRIIIILILFIATITLYAQKEGQEVYEPLKIKVAKTYTTPAKLSVDILIKDSRTFSKLYSDNIRRAVANYIKESYPRTKFNVIKNFRTDFKPEPNKILIRLDVVDYSVVKRNKQWIARTTIDVAVVDLRNNKVKKYQERISHRSAQVNRKGIQSAKLALNASFKIAVVKSVNYIENSIKGVNKYELVQRNQSVESNVKTQIETKPTALEDTKTEESKEFVSDIDINVPISAQKFPNRFALIIGNEDYNSYQTGLTSEINVEFAERDAKTFKEYAEKTLGIPNENIILIVDAKVVEFSKSIEKINSITKNLEGEAEIYFYYAGHGFPNEETKEPFLIPVDVSGTNLEFAISLNDVYKKFTEHPTKRVTVFLDACFSGGARNQGLLAARGVKVQPKGNILNGNLVVFAASSGTQSSLPYREQQHGLFTYFLLKKLQETNGNISMSEMADYLKKQVSVKSVMINDKEQNPQVNISPEIENVWQDWTIK